MATVVLTRRRFVWRRPDQPTRTVSPRPASPFSYFAPGISRICELYEDLSCPRKMWVRVRTPGMGALTQQFKKCYLMGTVGQVCFNYSVY
jgi:hypothetical protein